MELPSHAYRLPFIAFAAHHARAFSVAIRVQPG
jgi:hypothetical protein